MSMTTNGNYITGIDETRMLIQYYSGNKNGGFVGSLNHPVDRK